MEKKYPPRLTCIRKWTAKYGDEEHPWIASDREIKAICNDNAIYEYISLREHQALIAPLVEALEKIKDTESKCLLGPRIDEGERMVERASSSDDLMCWSHELGSHKAYVECSILANNALENYRNMGVKDEKSST